MWRYYADNGTGFAIKFNTNIHQTIKPNDTKSRTVIAHVTYGQGKCLQQINKFIDKLIQVQRSNMINKVTIEEIASTFLSHLLVTFPTMKDSSFQDEEEVRFFHFEGEGIIDPETQKPYYVNNNLRAYLQLKIIDKPFINYIIGKKPIIFPDKLEDINFEEIVIGPACNFEEARTAIIELLNEYSLDHIKISHSPLKFRP